jgi:hypothetical protein
MVDRPRLELGSFLFQRICNVAVSIQKHQVTSTYRGGYSLHKEEGVGFEPTILVAVCNLKRFRLLPLSTAEFSGCVTITPHP